MISQGLTFWETEEGEEGKSEADTQDVRSWWWALIREEREVR
jgi:hypothetical protein